MDIGSGDFVVAIRNSTLGRFSITAGHSYCVERLEVDKSPWPGAKCTLCGQADPIGIILVGMPDAHWCTSSFRKVPPARESWIRELEKPVEVLEPVDLRELVK